MKTINSGKSQEVSMTSKQIIGFIRVAIAISVLSTVNTVSPVWAATFTVTTTIDNGPGSQREAINSANANSGVPDVINFNIPGAGPHTIAPITPLPTINDPVIVNGY